MDRNFFKHSPDFTNSPEYVIFSDLLMKESIPEPFGYTLVMRCCEETLRNEKGIGAAHFNVLARRFGIPAEYVETITRLATESGLLNTSEDGSVAATAALECIEKMDEIRRERAEAGRRSGQARNKRKQAKTNTSKAEQSGTNTNKHEQTETNTNNGEQTKTKTKNITSTNVDVCSELFPAETAAEPQEEEVQQEIRENGVEYSEFSLELNTGELYRIPKKDLEEYKRLYPAVDTEQQLRNMSGWLRGHPERRKTKRGIESFINHWLSKEQDRGARNFGQNTQQSRLRVDPNAAESWGAVERGEM